jgi:hypothetical protein
VLQDKSIQTIFAALHKKDAEDNKEKDAFIILTKCHRNSEKKKKQ